MEISKEQAIYRYIRKHGAASKQDLVSALRYSLPTITQKLQALKEKKLIDTSEKFENTGGRNAIAYSYVSTAKVAIGLYLTSHHVSCVAVDLSGNMLGIRRTKRIFDLEDDEYRRFIAREVEEVKDDVRIGDDSLLGVGIALPGLISDDGERVIYGRTLGFTGMTREEIAAYIPYRNKLFHDSATAGFAQMWESEKTSNTFCISLSNSVGGAFIQGNQIYQGNSQRGGEIGHMLVEPHNGELCYCGNYGCFDTVCKSTILSDYTGGNLDEFFKLLDKGDGGAKALWNTYISYLAMAIRNIRMLFDSDIILGGYVGEYIGRYMDQLCEEVDRKNVFGDKAEDYIIPCINRTEDIAAGAAIMLIDEYISSI